MKRIVLFFITCMVGNVFGMDETKEVKAAKLTTPIFNIRSSSPTTEFKFRLSPEQHEQLITWLTKKNIVPKVTTIEDHYFNNPKDSFYAFNTDKKLWEAKGSLKIRCEYDGDKADGKLTKVTRNIRSFAHKLSINPKDITAALEMDKLLFPDYRVLLKNRTAYQFKDETGQEFEIDFDQYPDLDINYIEIDIKGEKLQAAKASAMICNLLVNTIGFKSCTLWDCNLTDMLLNPKHDFSQTVEFIEPAKA